MSDDAAPEPAPQDVQDVWDANDAGSVDNLLGLSDPSHLTHSEEGESESEGS